MSSREHWSTTRVSHIWRCQYVWNRSWSGGEGAQCTINGAIMALVSTHDRIQTNGIEEGAARELARVLQHNTCITHLNVRVCWRKEGGWMHGSRIALVSTHDRMQGNSIGEGGARELARALQLNTCITHLDARVRLWKRWGVHGAR